MNRKIVIPIIVLIILIMNSVMCYAIENVESSNINSQQYTIRIDDEANLLSNEEINILYNEMRDLVQYGNIIFKSINSNPFGSTKLYASEYYHKNYGTQSGTVFLIDMDERYIYIFSDGNNYNTITTEKAEIIIDNIYKYASNGEYCNCAKSAFSQMKALFEGEKIAEPMKYISNAFIAIMVALLTNFAIFRHATKIKKAENNEHIKESEFYLNHTPPDVRIIGQHREYSPVSDSSSGGSSSSGGRRRWRKQRRWRRSSILN